MRYGAKADITCLDYSVDMMGQAQEKADRLHLKNVTFRQGDVGALPFADGAFDIVLSLNGFHAFPDKEAAYRMLEECRRMYMDNPSLKRHLHYFHDVEIEYNWKVGNYNKALEILNEREGELLKINHLSILIEMRKTKADILWDMNRKEEAADLYRNFLLEQKREKERNEEVTTGEFATLLNMHRLNAE